MERSREWVRQDSELLLSVNISFVQFRSDDFLPSLFCLLEETGFPPENLVLEMTENVVMNQDLKTLEKLKFLRKSGIRISVDDFGTGYSSVNYLKEFPLDHMKIDKSFVNGLPDSKEDKAIVSSFIQLSKAFGMEVIAEGIETREQMDYLYHRGCYIMQGYLIGRPQEAEEIEKMIYSDSGLKTG